MFKKKKKLITDNYIIRLNNLMKGMFFNDVILTIITV